MDVESILSEVDSWPVQEQVRLAQALWDKLADAGVELELTEEQQAELDRRFADFEANPDDGIPWEDVKRSLLLQYADREASSRPLPESE